METGRAKERTTEAANILKTSVDKMKNSSQQPQPRNTPSNADQPNPSERVDNQY